MVFDSLCREDRSVKLYVVGGYDKSRVELLKSIVKDECRSRVTFTGRISKEELIELYSKSRVLIAPLFYESFPYVSLKAQASGTPVIASRSIPPGAIIDGMTGYRILDPRDIRSFKEKARTLLTNDTLWEEMSRNAGRHALNFDSILIAKQYLDILKERKLGQHPYLKRDAK
jgi:glycosyltransferase involved in cell wall biosynthesis